MRGWRIPIAVSALIHGLIALVAITRAPPERPRPRTERVAIRLTERPRRRPPAAKPEPAIEPKPEPAVKQEPEESKRTVETPRKPARPPAPPRPRGPREEESRPGPGTRAETGGEGVMVTPGPQQPGEGEAEPRDLSELDLSPKLSIPPFEAQGPGVRPPPPPKDPRKKSMAGGGYRFEDPAFTAKVARDGTVEFEDRGYDGETGPLTFEFDVNDWMMGAAGDDPYSHEKRQFLEATREERLAMARVACGERLSRSLVNLPARLEQIWRSGQPPADKRRVLFDLWDECAESGSPELKRYGQLARATILHFIETHLPKGSEHAYSSLELKRLNRERLSKVPFEPYRRKETL